MRFLEKGQNLVLRKASENEREIACSHYILILGIQSNTILKWPCVCLLLRISKTTANCPLQPKQLQIVFLCKSNETNEIEYRAFIMYVDVCRHKVVYSVQLLDTLEFILMGTRLHSELATKKGTF